jgi:hypothetical protein
MLCPANMLGVMLPFTALHGQGSAIEGRQILGYSLGVTLPLVPIAAPHLVLRPR